MGMTKYSIFELIFSNFQWVRKRSKSLWVKDTHENLPWVKFSDREINFYKLAGFNMEFTSPGLIVEDWRKSK